MLSTAHFCTMLVVLGAAFATAPHAAAGVASSAAAKMEFVMPAPGALIRSGAVVVAGRLPADVGYVNLILDGEPLLEVVREATSFRATFTPRSPGPHVIEARAGALTATLTFTYASGGGDQAPYRYHAPVLEGRCAECHAGMRRPSPKAESETCKSCHRKLAMIFPYLHGPIAVGKCLVCHDPHGSSWPALMPADARTLCTTCHDQPGSLEHVEQARSRVCHLCHNPHASMNKKLLYEIVK